MHNKNYFVIAAVVAGELNKAMVIARQILLTASNARALALRAGQGAAGFRPITDFIDELAGSTVTTSQTINQKAQRLSQIAAESARATAALDYFNGVYKKAPDAPYLGSLKPAYERTAKCQRELATEFSAEAKALNEELQHLNKALRTAQIISTMSSVEASQAGSVFEAPLNNVATNVAESAQAIQHHVRYSLQLFSEIVKDDHAYKRTV
ncbi:chemotaxis protein [Thaumasiovibrio subtropicus]|uniref:chemotaxis protein n=1 Tax=Thaumasiovibrio subtropicus TaxID=1891207 RepID=UPI000B34B069|nr:chemotaxis protein [Thaumasiovibrio subtropicus]